eukprot:m.371703 g.371703  ORF g.371703 m.371703 type:complete len:61 (+) comp59502_c0_seq1:73-255(+)
MQHCHHHHHITMDTITRTHFPLNGLLTCLWHFNKHTSFSRPYFLEIQMHELSVVSTFVSH